MELYDRPESALTEGANGPTTHEADRILYDRGVFLIPDVLANAGGGAGGVAISCFEWVHDLRSYFWKESEVNDRLETVLRPPHCSGVSILEIHPAFSDLQPLRLESRCPR